MKKCVSFLAIMLACFNLMSQTSNMDALRNLGGTWVMEAGDTRIYEIWKLNGAKLSGHSYKVFRGDTTFLETIELEESDTGIYYRPTVPNQNAGKQVSFKFNRVENKSYHFINLQHDFPKRIVYTLKGPDELEVMIDDAMEITKKRSVYKFRRVAN